MTDFPYNKLDPPAEVAVVEPYPYGKPRFPNLDPRAYFDEQTRKNYANDSAWTDFREVAPWALAGIRRAAGPTTQIQPMTPQLVRREAKQAGDDSAGQHVYEALLGRTRQAGDAVGKSHGSMWQNPVTYIVGGLGAAGGGWLGDKIFGGVDAVRELTAINTPGTAEHEAEQKRVAAIKEEFRQRGINRDSHYSEKEALYGPPPTIWKNGLGSMGEAMDQAKWYDGWSGRPSAKNPLPWANGIPYPPDPNKP